MDCVIAAVGGLLAGSISLMVLWPWPSKSPFTVPLARPPTPPAPPTLDAADVDRAADVDKAAEYAEQRILDMLEPAHWAAVVARVNAGEGGFQIARSGVNVVLDACGLRVFVRLLEGQIPYAFLDSGFGESRNLYRPYSNPVLTTCTAKAFHDAVEATWPDLSPPLWEVPKPVDSLRAEDWIALCEAERARLGCGAVPDSGAPTP